MKREKEIYQVTIIGSIINFVLLTLKFLAGIYGHSAAMIADAVHSLSDFITDIIVIVFVHISGKPQDESHDYGHGKYETLATAIIGIFLLAVGGGIFWEGATSVYLFFKGTAIPSPSYIAFVMALVSIISKELLYQYTVHVGKRLNSQVVIANAWHHRSDALSSIGTAIGIGGAILGGSKWHVLDPLAALIVSLFIMKISYQMLIPCIDELLEKSLPADVERQISDVVLTCPGVCQMHHLRTRRIGNHYAIEMHIRMDGDMKLRDAHQKASDIEHKLKEIFGEATHIGIHVEPIK